MKKTKPPTAPWAPQHKWLPTAPGVCSRCVFTAVCVIFGWVKCRARIPSMGHHTWPYVTSLSLNSAIRTLFKIMLKCTSFSQEFYFMHSQGIKFNLLNYYNLMPFYCFYLTIFRCFVLNYFIHNKLHFLPFIFVECW